MRRKLADAVATLPPRPLEPHESQALERAIGLSLTPQERLDWLETTMEELAGLRRLAPKGGPDRRKPVD